jgi:uncharacterized NAD(P)/FAD-binding protein YdhS
MVACQLLRRGLDITLFERRGVFGPGLAYGAAGPGHLLNVPAGNMSAWPDAPRDFLEWGLRLGKPWSGGTFAPRLDYGRYLRDVLNEAGSAGGAALVRVVGEVEACLPVDGGVFVGWSDGDGARGEAQFDGAVLALGNLPPAPVAGIEGLPRSVYAPDPWAAGALALASPSDPVLLIGTGLTMVDVAMTLAAGEHRGPIIAVSRRGLLPQPHRAHPRPPSYAPPPGVEAWARDTLSLFRNVRAEIERAQRRGVDWRDVINSLRKATPQLWRSLSVDERRRFLRHVRPYWEVLRHRTPPSVDGRLQELLMTGQLRVLAGRVASVSLEPGEGGEAAARVAIRPRGATAEVVLRAGRIVNCTGPGASLARGGAQGGLIGFLMEEGLARADEFGLGLATSDDGELLDATGRPVPGVWHAGPLARGSAWEATAVPELRVQAAVVASAVAGRLAARGRVSLG